MSDGPWAVLYASNSSPGRPKGVPSTSMQGTRLRGTSRIQLLFQAKTLWLSSFFLILVLVNIAVAEDIKVRAGVDKNTVTIGERSRDTIEVNAAKGISFEFPPAPEGALGNLSVKEIIPSKKKQTYILETFEPGKYTIPKIAIKYKKGGESTWLLRETDEVVVNVESVLAKHPNETDIRDIKGPLEFPSKYAWLAIFLAAALILLLGTIIVAYLGNKYRALKKEIRAKLPHEIAYERLEALKRKQWAELGLIEEYYVELSDIVRHYLEQRFNLRAPEMTTEEFLTKTKEEASFAPEHKSLLKDFLLHCDLVKFAKYGPSANEMELSFNAAKRLVDQTKQE
jgi:hypothetical protein